MSQNPYAIPVEDLVGAARVPDAEQVEVRAEPRRPDTGWSGVPSPYADGTGGDADSD